jgi:hypothetical protein
LLNLNIIQYENAGGFLKYGSCVAAVQLWTAVMEWPLFPQGVESKEVRTPGEGEKDDGGAEKHG